jgi:hypothetical protein
LTFDLTGPGAWGQCHAYREGNQYDIGVWLSWLPV